MPDLPSQASSLLQRRQRAGWWWLVCIEEDESFSGERSSKTSSMAPMGAMGVEIEDGTGRSRAAIVVLQKHLLHLLPTSACIFLQRASFQRFSEQNTASNNNACVLYGALIERDEKRRKG
ncbi:hypothetical protein OsI_25089 [Oryza sativa Indica Group]|nr:hypothetical protein OsI_25089 [Oryza sativa Indica Group]